MADSESERGPPRERGGPFPPTRRKSRIGLASRSRIGPTTRRGRIGLAVEEAKKRLRRLCSCITTAVRERLCVTNAEQGSTVGEGALHPARRELKVELSTTTTSMPNIKPTGRSEVGRSPETLPAHTRRTGTQPRIARLYVQPEPLLSEDRVEVHANVRSQRGGQCPSLKMEGCAHSGWRKSPTRHRERCAANSAALTEAVFTNEEWGADPMTNEDYTSYHPRYIGGGSPVSRARYPSQRGTRVAEGPSARPEMAQGTGRPAPRRADADARNTNPAPVAGASGRRPGASEGGGGPAQPGGTQAPAGLKQVQRHDNGNAVREMTIVDRGMPRRECATVIIAHPAQALMNQDATGGVSQHSAERE